ncbi:hypothetical protein [Gracilimonas sp.]|uniref:hypothetical protein n=1 Tax=Gracilimonas sp. TaxID=1974203 RepID=UPI002871E18F|nr:hypothetical protein [Gracilimonas sp.]
MNPYWVYPKGDEWVMLAFAETAREARKLGWKHSPVAEHEAPYIDWRARRADDKWMKVYNGKEVIDSCPLPYDTFEQWWEGEYEI